MTVNREILFRGKRVDNGKWIEGSFVKYTDCDGNKVYLIYASNGNPNNIIPETVGQFTGLTDKNGKKIFEGDIMPVWENGEEYLYKVVYCGDCFMLAMLDSEQGSYPLSIKHNISEIIGNIHDNKKKVKHFLLLL